jgi:AmiR/NasT family two-component response regulator
MKALRCAVYLKQVMCQTLFGYAASNLYALVRCLLAPLFSFLHKKTFRHMTTALILFTDDPSERAHAQAALEAHAIRVLHADSGLEGLPTLVAKLAPDVVLAVVHCVDDALLQGVSGLPLPVLLCARHWSPGDANRAVQAGVALCAHRPEADWSHCILWLEEAQARWQQRLQLKQTIEELTQKLEERKAVERAKGLLMQARQVTDDEAFRILRTVSMHANQRLGEVSQQIIHSAHFAESVNRAGQLRMLSQRLAKLYLLRLAGIGQKRFLLALQESTLRLDDHLLWLSRKTDHALVHELQGVWQEFKAQLDAPLEQQRWSVINRQAETLLAGAEQLTGALELAGAVAPLHILNIAGRQRMLSQRYAKNALLMLRGQEDAAELESEMADLRDSFETSLAHLNSVPLSTPDIRDRLETASLCWRQMLQALAPAQGQSAATRKERLERVAVASETLLSVFDDLSAQYQHSLDMLLG